MSMSSYIRMFAEYIAMVKRRSAHTILSYQTDLSSFMKYCLVNFEQDSIIAISHIHIRSWIISLKEEGQSHTTINRKISTLKTFYKFLMRDEVIKVNPMLKVQTLKNARRLPSFVSQQKMEYLLKSELGEVNFDVARDQIIVELLYFTGMRRSELINLKYGDIDYARNDLTVLGKGNKERKLPLTASIIAKIETFQSIVLSQFGTLAHDFIIVTNSGVKSYPKLIYNAVSKSLKSINAADKTSPHVLRHTYATHLSSNGAELNAVKELLGHSSLAATQVYTHNSIERLRTAYKKAHPKG